jgi:hypothetical protein
LNYYETAVSDPVLLQGKGVSEGIYQNTTVFIACKFPEWFEIVDFFNLKDYYYFNGLVIQSIYRIQQALLAPMFL